MTPEERLHCAICLDTGFRNFWCIGGGAMKQPDASPRLVAKTFYVERYYCGRKLIHAPHAYVERCTCVDTNPVIARQRELTSQFVQRRAAR